MTKEIKTSFTLTELCAELTLSPSWVKKIEKHLGLHSWGSGQRGKKSFYSEHQFEFFRKIVILRASGFGLDEIKGLFDKELEILNYAMDSFPMDEDTDEGGAPRMTTIPVYLLVNIYCGPTGIEINMTKYNDQMSREVEQAKELKTMEAEYGEMMKEVNKRFKSMKKHMTAEAKNIEKFK
jgi:DNA-binding transcriptional MerR regulator